MVISQDNIVDWGFISREEIVTLCDKLKGTITTCPDGEFVHLHKQWAKPVEVNGDVLTLNLKTLSELNSKAYIYKVGVIITENTFDDGTLASCEVDYVASRVKFLYWIKETLCRTEYF